MNFPRKNAWIRVRQQPRLFKHQLAHGPQVFNGRAEPALLQPLAIFRITQLRFIAQTEQRFLAAGLLPRARDGQHLIGSHGVRLAVARFARERAVSAAIPAEVRQWYKDLARIRDYRAGARVTNGAGLPQEVDQFAAGGADQPARFSARDCRLDMG